MSENGSCIKIPAAIIKFNEKFFRSDEKAITIHGKLFRWIKTDPSPPNILLKSFLGGFLQIPPIQFIIVIADTINVLLTPDEQLTPNNFTTFECTICYEIRDKSVARIFVPCGHCYCFQCCEKILNRSCPKCRATIADTLRPRFD